MSTPSIPPRPQRPAAKNEIPSIPPRPIRNASVSPSREAATRSPLNGPPSSSKFYIHGNRSSTDSLRRPPSVAALPTLGQEGDEYSSYDQLPADSHNITVDDDPDLPNAIPVPQQNVAADVPIQQPLASLPASTAARQVQTVTRTDSAQAAAVGLTDNSNAIPRTSEHRRKSSTADQLPLRNKASFNRSSSGFQPLERTTSRPGSVHSDHEHGIPEIGMQIPLYKNAGDVQAPSPAPGYSQHTPGIGFFNDGSTRAHTRRRSAQHKFGPPDSYGLQHDHDHQGQFEREWAAKHPQEAAQEESHLHVPRPATALSSDQLNRLVGLPSTEGGVGTSTQVVSTPDPDVAFEASDDYVGRNASPQASRAEASPLRKSSVMQEHGAAETEGVHLQPSSRAINKVTGGGRADHKLPLGSTADYDSVDEFDDGAPILASDEVIKRPGSAFMHAAVNPEAYHSGDDAAYDSDGAWSQGRRSSVQLGARSSSRPSSRPNSVYQGGSLHRFVSHEDVSHTGTGTPLEEIEEYEPLFPDDDKGVASAVPKKLAKKRPDLASYHFPSQDTWEDTPASLQYLATVSTPEVDREATAGSRLAATTAEGTFETPEAEAQRREQNPADMTSDSKTFAKPHFKPGVSDDMHAMRPGVNRFPSSDVWEDTPDSMRLETTVSGPQMDDSRALPDERPTTSAIPSQQDDGTARASTGLGTSARPVVPSRPERKSKLAQEVTPTEDSAENVDDGSASKSKPTIPARPARPSRSIDADDAVTAPAAPKPKPAVPARPGGEKIAALRAGFMSDLNNRLKLGPQGVAPPSRRADADSSAEPEQQQQQRAAPLADARKTRTRGPARRKPATHTPSPPPAAAQKLGFSTFTMSPLITVWTIDEEDELLVSDDKPAVKDVHAPLSGSLTEHHSLAEQVEEEDDDDDDDDEDDEIDEDDDDAAHDLSASVHDPATIAHTLQKESHLSSFPPETLGAEGDRPARDVGDAIPASALHDPQSVQPALEKALATAPPPAE